jgi:hypothetical protein
MNSGTVLEVSAGGFYSLQSGGSAVEQFGGNLTQAVGGGYEEQIEHQYKQEVGGAYKQRIESDYEQEVGGTWKAGSFGSLSLLSSKVQLGGESSCAAAARVGSEVNNMLRVTKEGSSKTVSVC